MDFFRRREDTAATTPTPPADLTDEQALQRYRYLLATAPPEDIERAHEEAFARLTPDQRRQALEALAKHVPASEIQGDDPAALARTATRAEMRQSGTIERAWGPGAGAGFGLGSFFLATLAGSFIGTAIAQQLFADDLAAGEADAGSGEGGDPGDSGDSGGSGDMADAGDGGWGGGGDFGGGDLGGGDFGDFGGF
jgi:hypothetical protein